jgi:hypothetical protein
MAKARLVAASNITSARTKRPSGNARRIPAPVKNLLWGVSAGRCEFEGCNRPLWKNDLTQDVRSLGDKAHIRAFSPSGPRRDNGTDTGGLNEIANLMLLCLPCHRTIDSADGPAKFTDERLRAMKAAHEARISAACDVDASRISHVLEYATHVGAHHALPAFSDASVALLGQRRYPASTVLDLSTRDGADSAVDLDFWAREAKRLEQQFDRQVRQPLERGEIEHISVFALAPQPLLIKLGTLLGDISPVDVYQRHREPPAWEWPNEAEPLAFQVTEPQGGARQAALVLSVSATVLRNRIERVLGSDVDIWSVAIPTPSNDAVRLRTTLSEFRSTLRHLLDRIKTVHGHSRPLHIFPAIPVSLAVELGRIRMPKADTPWIIYDEQQSRGGFVRALTFAPGE